MALLKCMLNELHGDHAQSLQLATVAQTLIKDDEAEQSKKTDPDRSVLLSMVGIDTALDSLLAKKVLTYHRYESSLLELNEMVQRER